MEENNDRWGVQCVPSELSQVVRKAREDVRWHSERIKAGNHRIELVILNHRPSHSAHCYAETETEDHKGEESEHMLAKTII